MPDEVDRALSGAAARHHCDGVLLRNICFKHAGIQFTRRFAMEKEGPLELEDLKAFHTALALVTDPTAGRYRKCEGPMLPYVHSITRPPSISYRLRKLVEYMREAEISVHPIRAAALIHHEFMSIWPFDHRSGTAGRLLLNFWLLRANYPPAIIHAKDRHAYFSALSGGAEAMVPVVIDAMGMILDGAESQLRIRVA